MRAISRFLAVSVPVGLVLAALCWWRASDARRADAAPPPAAPPAAAARPAAAPATPAIAAQPANTAPAPSVATQSVPRPSFGQAFAVWAETFAASPATAKAALLADGEKLAKARQEEMARLIQADPEQALKEALPYRLRKQLPPEIAGLIEQPVSGRGAFNAIHVDPLPGYEGQMATMIFEFELNRQVYDVYPYGRRLAMPSRRGLWLNGISAHDQKGKPVMALNAEPLRRLDPEEARDLMAAAKLPETRPCLVCRKATPQAAAACAEYDGNLLTFCGPAHRARLNDQFTLMEATLAAGRLRAAGSPPDQLPPGPLTGTQGIKKLLLMPALFSDDPVPPASQDQMQAAAENNNRFYVENSYGTMSWETTITPPLRLPYSKIYYGENVGQTFGDAVAVAATLGYFQRDYNQGYVLFNSLSPQVNFGGRSDGLLNASLGAIPHELGHNLGLGHANYWDVAGARPGPVQPRNQPPWPIDIDSLIGHDDVNAPFILGLARDIPILEYGDIYDVMGSGGGHFGSALKYVLKWLNEPQIRFLSGSSTNRVFAFDTPHVAPGRLYALWFEKEDASEIPREYWFSYRQGINGNPWMENGLVVQWAGAMTRLVDTTPTTAPGRYDAAVVVGRTFQDPQAAAYITPIARGSIGPDPGDQYLDVVVHLGRFPTNVPPTMSLQASALIVSNGATVNFTATAQDANGDSLAYYWEFGDTSFSAANAPAVSHTFTNDGQYVVRSEVSDMKGGVASAYVVVVVGTPTTVTMSGRVVDVNGNPVQGVRVHNSGSMPNGGALGRVNGQVNLLADADKGTYRYSYTDSQGYYTIGNIPQGVYTNRAFLYGYECVPQFFDPVDLRSGSVSGLNQLAVPITKVSIVRQEDAAEPGTPGRFTATRTGDISQDLKVRFTATGTAVSGEDYVPFGGISVTTVVVVTNEDGTLSTNETVTTDPNYFLIPAGFASTDLIVTPIDNAIFTGTKTVIANLLLETNDFRYTTTLTNVVSTNGGVTVTNTVFITRTNQVRIPGWDLRTVGPNDDLGWVQTYPIYVLGDDRAILLLTDDDPPGPAQVSVGTLDADAVETGSDSAVLYFMRFAGDINSDLVINYSLSGTASNGLDYVRLPGTITIPAGSYFALLEVRAIEDLFVEGNETVHLTITPDPAYEVGSGDAEVMIIDDDLPLITVYASDSVAVIGGANRGRVTFSREGDLTGPLQVNYLVSGTATSSVDFVQLPGTVTIPAGLITASIDITPVTNPSFIGPRTVIIQVSDSPTYNITRHNSAVVVIEPDLPVITLTGTPTDIGESGGSSTLTFTRSGPTNNTLLVFFEVGGTAVPGQDYAAIGTNVLFAPGAATATIAVAAINDNARERGDSSGFDKVIVHLAEGPDYLVGSPNAVTVTITDDEQDTALPGVSFMQRESSVREDAGAVTIPVRVSANPATNRVPVIVEYRIVSGTALPGINYTPIPDATGTVQFVHFTAPDPPDRFLSPEDGIALISIPILDDGLAAGNKTFTLQLSDPRRYQTNFTYVTNQGNIFTNSIITPIPTNAIVRDWFQHTVTIIDIGVNVVSIAGEPIAYETGPTGAKFTITREGSTANPLTVYLSTSGNTAPGNDFVAPGTNGTITIPAGTNTVSFTLLPFDDPTEETAEEVIVNLVQRPGYTVGSPDSARVILVNNDGTIQFLSSSFDVDEDAGSALIGVQRSGETNSTVSVDYRTFDGTASNGVDYIAVSGTLTFTPGEVLKTFPVPIINDARVEPLETVNLVLTNATGGAPLGGQRTAILFIADDDTAFEFAADAFRANENGTNAAVVVNRLGVVRRTNTVTFATADLSATNGLDYLGTNVTLTFLPGQSNQTVLIPLLDDALFEGNETVRLTLANAPLGARSNAVLTIVDDECTVEFAAPDFRAAEYAGFATVEVRRLGGTVNTVSVDFFTADGTALNNADYLQASGTVTFAGDGVVLSTNGNGSLVFQPGETNQTIRIQLLDDQIGEGNETFSVVLTNLTGPAVGALPGSTVLGSNNVALVTIVDNETPGSVEAEFNPNIGANGRIRAVAQQSDGRTVFGGDFTEFDETTFNYVARLTVNGLLDPSFNPGFGANDAVYAVAIAPDDKIYLGGAFTTMDGQNRARITRLNVAGELDPSFDPQLGFNGLVRALAVQYDGRVVAGGDFTSFNGTPRGHLLRLATNGVIDGTFQASVNGPVHALVVMPDGRVLVGGLFNNVNGTVVNNLVRLTPAGTLDSGFAPPAGIDGAVRALALQPDGRILVGGTFNTIGGASKAFLARLNADGSLEPSFRQGSGPNGPVNALAVHASGRIIAAGEFTTYNGLDRNRFVRLRNSGSVDTVFDIGTGANAPVLATLVQSNTAVVIAGEFTQVNGLNRGYIARIHGEERMEITEVGVGLAQYRVPENAGSVTVTVERSGNTNAGFTVDYTTADMSAQAGLDYDPVSGSLTFQPGEVSQSVTIGIRQDLLVETNEIFAFIVTNVSSGVYLGAISVAEIVIVDDEQSVQFVSDQFRVAEGATNALITVRRSGLPFGTVSVDFVTADGTARGGVDFLGVTNTLTFADGQEFQDVLVPIIDDTQIESNETFIVSLLNPGAGVSITEPASATVTIEDNELGPGSVDVTFTPGAGADDLVRTLAMQADGKILVGGAFMQFDNTNRIRVARLNYDGTLDRGFDPGAGADGLVTGLGVRPDGRIMLAGAFTNVNGLAFNRVARLHTNGAVDLTLNRVAPFNANINAMSVMANGNAVVVGGFSLPNAGITRLRNDGSADVSFYPGAGANGPVHAVCLCADGSVVAGGAFTAVDNVPRRRVARFFSTGSLDPAFVPPSDIAGLVYAVAVQADRRVIIGGDFTSVSGSSRRGLARLEADGKLDTTFDPGTGANGIVWAVALLPDGKVLVGGSFTTLNGLDQPHIARLTESGAVDQLFAQGQGPNGTVYAILPMPDAKVIIGGSFTQVNGQPRAGVARLNGDQFDIEILSAGFVAGQWHTRASTLPGHSYVLEATSDLTTWSGLATNVAGGFLLDFSDPSTNGPPMRFYRVRQVWP